jgi:Ca2+-binding EF-hand superfamily protein
MWRFRKTFLTCFYFALKKLQSWNVTEYLQSIFNNFDSDHNGSITANELLVALSKTHHMFNFDPKTVDFMLKKFDANNDNRISFSEFVQLYSFINDELSKFLMCGASSTGTIDINQFSNLLSSRGVRINPQTSNYIVSNVEQTLQKRITFDVFCRVSARYDYLSNAYHQMQKQFASQSFEQYLTNNFFAEFW